MKNDSFLQFSETPFDRMTREELIQTCIAAYGALGDAVNALTIVKPLCKHDAYFETDKPGQLAIIKGLEALKSMRAGHCAEEVNDAFFKYVTKKQPSVLEWYRCQNTTCGAIFHSYEIGTHAQPDQRCKNCSHKLKAFDITEVRKQELHNGPGRSYTIALDHDGTASVDPDAFKHFAEFMRSRGHKVHLVTMRYPSECKALTHWLPYVDSIIGTSRMGKRAHLEKLGINAHIWIDDCPDAILHDGEVLWPGMVAPEGHVIVNTHNGVDNGGHVKPKTHV